MSKIKKIFQKKFIRNVMVVASGTAMAQLVTMLFSPIITRIYGPEIYGVFGVYISLVTIFLPIVALTYPIATVLPKSEEEAKRLVRLSVLLTTLLSLGMLIIILFFGNALTSLLNVQVLAPYLLLIPLMMFFEGFFQIMNQWLIRTKQFQVKARMAVVQSLTVNSSHAVLGIIYPYSSTLIIVGTLGKGFYALLLVWGSGIKIRFKSFFKSMKSSGNIQELKEVANKYSDFPKYRSPQVFIHGLSEGLPILMLTTFFGPAAAGFYAIGNRVLATPTSLIGNAIGDVFYPRIVEGAHKGERITKLLLKANLLLALIGVIPFGTIILFGPWIFSLIFGEAWHTAGIYASWLSLWSYFILISRPTIKTLQVIGEQKFHLYFTIMTIILRTIGLLIGIFLLKNDVNTIIIYSIIGALLYLYLIIITLIKTKEKEKNSSSVRIF